MGTPENSTNVTLANPQDQLLFLLGGMDAKIDGVVREQAAARVDAAEFRAEVKTEVAALRGDVNTVVGRVDVLESKEHPRAPWYSVVVGVSAIIGGTTGGLLLINYLANLPH